MPAFRVVARPLCLRPLRVGVLRRTYTSQGIIQEGDVVSIRRVRGGRSTHLSPPLKPDREFSVEGCSLKGSDLIGRPYHDVVAADKERKTFRLTETNLASYVVHTPRLVTPIYPADANLIVSMLDIDLPAPGEDPLVDSGPPFEIFEAGTGHGGLTLHLSRAIHGANPPVPSVLRTALLHAEYVPKRARFATKDPGDGLPTTSSPERPDPNSLVLPAEDVVSAYQAYLPTRRAIIQSLDISSEHSRRAHQNIRGFRRGLYALDSSLHVGTVSGYLASRFLAQSDEPFLAHAILDLPDPFADQTSVELLTAALRPDGLLLLFCPSITQIAEFIQEATRRGLPYVTSRVVELPTNTMDSNPKDGQPQSNSGGRDWSVEHTVVSEGSYRKVLTRCRPKVGTLKVVGGGFVGVFQKVKPKQPQVDKVTRLLQMLRERAQVDGVEAALQDLSEELSKNGILETAA